MAVLVADTIPDTGPELSTAAVKGAVRYKAAIPASFIYYSPKFCPHLK